MNGIQNRSLGSIRSAYLQAKQENDSAEMNRLKQEAMQVMNEQKQQENTQVKGLDRL